MPIGAGFRPQPRRRPRGLEQVAGDLAPGGVTVAMYRAVGNRVELMLGWPEMLIERGEVEGNGGFIARLFVTGLLA